MNAWILSMILQLALTGIEINPGQMDKDIVWLRTGSFCWWVDLAQRKDGPKPAKWQSAYDFIYATQTYHIAKGNVKNDGGNKPLCVAVLGADTSLLYAAAPAPVPLATSITPGGTMTTPEGVWTFGTATASGGNAILLNGNPAGGGYGTKLIATGGKVYTFTAVNQWYVWNNGWTAAAAPQ